MKPTSKFIVIILLACLIAGFAPKAFAEPAATLWQYQCIDTMKDSRDNARNWSNRTDLIPLVTKEISAIKSLGANCVSVGTPYDDEFGAYLRVWVDQAHKQGLKIWFRGNLAGWEGWFSYPLLSGVSEHHEKIKHFILSHPSYFNDGDIFTPAPEPEAGKIIGDPRNSESQKREFLDFLVDSYDNCVSSFELIDVKAVCGFFSTNGDIAKHILTPETVAKIGNVVVVDHYVSDPSVLVSDLVNLQEKFKTKIMLGEFGAPIPDLNGNMSQSQQADFINTVFKGLVEHRDFMLGANYWVLTDGSSALYGPNLTPREAAAVVKNYYIPASIKGAVTDTQGKKLSGVQVKLENGPEKVNTDENGQYSITAPPGQAQITVEREAYKSESTLVTAVSGKEISKNFTLQAKNLGWWGKVLDFVKGLFK